MAATDITKTSQLSNSRTRQEWAAVINADWRKSIESIIQAGRDLIAAKAELPHGEFLAMIETDLPFGRETARKLMAIGQDPKIEEANSSCNLPPSWRVLSFLTPLSEDDFRAGINSGIISPTTSLRAADAYQGALRKPKGETWGENRKPSTLPSPKEAKDIARETGRFVAANDGNVYSGADEEQAEDYSRRRTEAFRVLEAINTLASAGNGYLIAKNMEPHWLQDFSTYSIEEAEQFLSQFCMGIGLRADLAMIDEDGADA